MPVSKRSRRTGPTVTIPHIEVRDNTPVENAMDALLAHVLNPPCMSDVDEYEYRDWVEDAEYLGRVLKAQIILADAGATILRRRP